MEREDERLSTRDIASGTQDPEAERDTALAEPVDSPPADAAAVPDERSDRDASDAGAELSTSWRFFLVYPAMAAGVYEDAT